MGVDMGVSRAMAIANALHVQWHSACVRFLSWASRRARRSLAPALATRRGAPLAGGGGLVFTGLGAGGLHI